LPKQYKDFDLHDVANLYETIIHLIYERDMAREQVSALRTNIEVLERDNAQLDALLNSDTRPKKAS
jgi:hypothetical protein